MPSVATKSLNLTIGAMSRAASDPEGLSYPPSEPFDSGGACSLVHAAVNSLLSHARHLLPARKFGSSDETD
ncbi:hypothetical protein AYM40_07350 [Paraburkholderia phytofirmans OLGA172]|uniref:Uncharacterized protein n=1 Tax=Paraburkholderia phytofirmans OLGA172 TaxID=1417228 RepID=A0A160FIT8_9BURK|nr:hypothetical protein AYM40_07350 [Paraburkholderia phytofirmans OLGA172]